MGCGSTGASCVHLLGNAVQHGDGGPITLELHGADESVALNVHNAGNPIPRSTQAVIFEPLSRGESGGPHSIGLGLFIARAVVTAHGGEIAVISPADVGTTREDGARW